MVGRLVLKMSLFHKFPYNPFKMYYSRTVVGSWSSNASLSLVRLNYIKIADPHTHAKTGTQFLPTKKDHHNFFCQHLSGSFNDLKGSCPDARNEELAAVDFSSFSLI